jgi:nucleotide-binding universal stress UspA family protein
MVRMIEKRILVPLDFSPCSLDVLEAAEQAALDEACGLVLLHAVEPFDAMRQRPPRVLTDVLEDYARLVKRVPPNQVHARALEGDPIDVILDAVTAFRCHRIVMGRGGTAGRPGPVARAVQKRFPGRVRLISPQSRAVVPR